jgi:hypothetical protein
MITVTIHLSEDSWYYQVRQGPALNPSLKLRPLTYTSVRTRTFHSFVTPWQYMVVLEY